MEEFIWYNFLIFTTKIKLWIYKWTYFDVDFQFNVKSLSYMSYMVDSSLVEVNTKFSPLLTSDILRRPQKFENEVREFFQTLWPSHNICELYILELVDFCCIFVWKLSSYTMDIVCTTCPLDLMQICLKIAKSFMEAGAITYSLRQ